MFFIWLLIGVIAIISLIEDLKATRHCARCRQLLEKHKPDSEIKCPVCGWIWK